MKSSVARNLAPKNLDWYILGSLKSIIVKHANYYYNCSNILIRYNEATKEILCGIIYNPNSWLSNLKFASTKPAGYRYITRNKHPNYPELPKSNNYENSWNSSDNLRNSNSFYSVTCSVEFFIEEEHKHYNRLSNYVFEPMSTLNLEYLNAHYEQNDVIPIYDNIPCYPHYDEAVLHMKKDKDNLHLWLVDIINLLYDYNIQATQANSEIENRIAIGNLLCMQYR